MGEPRPGDIPDPTHVKTGNALLKSGQLAGVGEWITYDTVSDFWAVAVKVAERAIGTDALQLQQDINSLNPLLADGVVNAAAFGNGSWVYAFIGGDVLPNSEVFLKVFDQGGAIFEIGFANTITFNGDISVATNVATVITDEVHNFKIGNKTIVVAASLAETGVAVIITGVAADGLSFTFTTTTADFASETATAANNAIDNGGVAKFIKRSGDTFTQKGVLNEIGIFSMTGARL